MPKCQNCNKDFPNRINVDDKIRNISKRKYCLECSPFGEHNTKKIHVQSKTFICKGCGKESVCKRNGRKYCSNQCQGNYRKRETQKKIEQGKSVCSNALKTYLIEQRGHCCEICGIEEWQDEPVPLVMDHIDGNSENNDLENLRVICCNCDAQLPTYKGANRGNGRHYRRQRYAAGKSY